MHYNIKIYHDDDVNLAEWFKSGLNTLFLHSKINFKIAKIPLPTDIDFLTLPEKIKNMLRLDKTDIISTILIDGIEEPFFAIEHTKSAPAGDHIQQRMARIIAAAENNVPIFYFVLPKKTNIKLQSFKLQPYNYHFTDKITKINNSPAVLIASNSEDKNFPDCPDLEHKDTKSYFKIIKDVLNAKVKDENIFKITSLINILNQQKKYTEGKKTLVEFYYKIIKLGKTLEEIETSDLEKFLTNITSLKKKQIEEIIKNLPPRIKNRRKTLIIYASRLFEHSGDPYPGKLAIYDYAFCRTAKNVEMRSRNLFLIGRTIQNQKRYTIDSIEDEFSKKYNDYYFKKDPFKIKKPKNIKESLSIAHALQYGSVYTKQRPLRIYGYFSDMIIFRDAVLMF